MKSINNNIEGITVIEKSKFITKLFKVENEDEVTNILKNLKNEYNDSTHICYAYIIDTVKRFNDDGEPSGTAGMPILNVLENNNLNYVLAVVIRYFGGIKLGAGGLVRAYSNSVSNLVKDNIVEYKLGMQVEITFNYDHIKEIDNLLKDEEIAEKHFDEKIKYIVNIKNEITFPKDVKIDKIKDIYIKV